jgi:hypothetical protein
VRRNISRSATLHADISLEKLGILVVSRANDDFLLTAVDLLSNIQLTKHEAGASW